MHVMEMGGVIRDLNWLLEKKLKLGITSPDSYSTGFNIELVTYDLGELLPFLESRKDCALESLGGVNQPTAQTGGSNEEVDGSNGRWHIGGFSEFG